MKIFRTTPPPEPDNDDAPKIVIHVPPPPDDVLEIDIGNIMFAGEPSCAVSIVDPTGAAWDPVLSQERVLEAVEKFLASDDDWLQLTTPKDGEPVLLHRALVEKLCLVQCAKAQMRKDHMKPRVPKGVQLVRGAGSIEDMIRGGRN